ncbi:hypothetical protein V8D89_007701, partial [Ganoderma adspersum]
PAVSGILAAYIPSELAGLTVLQLKTLCKENKVSGYSKLSKQSLIERLSGLTSGAPGGHTSNAPVVSCARPPAVSAITSRLFPPDSYKGHSHDSGREKETPHSTSSAGPAPSALATADTSKVTTRPTGKSHKTRPPSLAIERPSVTETISTFGVKVAIDKGGSRPVRHTAPRVTSPASNSLPRPSASSSCVTMSAGLSSSQPPSRGTHKHIQQSVECMPLPSKRSRLLLPASTPKRPEIISSFAPPLAPSKRFKPLVVDKSKLQSPPGQLPARPAMETPAAGDRSVAWSSEASLANLELDHFTTVPELFPITMPPTLSQRKRVHRWAMILSGLSNAERAVCVQVSRAFRYAVYLSAGSILTRDYAGRRLQEDILGRYSQAMTNMWPYLRLREAEVSRRRHVYKASFVSLFFEKLGLPNPIATRIWASPDNPKQISVAVRFALTRAWFELSVGSPHDSRTNPDSWLHGTIVDVQEVVPTEVWSVTIEHAANRTRPRRRETLYVLEATCEVIGLPVIGVADSASGVRATSTSYPLRVDWSTYVAHRMVHATESSTADQLLSHLKWACQEDYDRGISTLWLRKIAMEGQAGTAKRTVAERYVLASVIGNSISGQWMTTNEMAQEFAGLPARVGAQRGRKNATLNLFLPEHHHVESVHFKASGGRDFHPALAVVQTPHREYYVLRDNGMQVGCEEDGVAEVWQDVLRCDARGVSL